MEKLIKKCLCGGFLCILSVWVAPATTDCRAQDSPVEFAQFELWGPPPQSAHRVVQQPQWLSPKQAEARALHELVHPPLATIQGAVLEPTWRQPYAYGYFGARSHRQPVRHFGYRQNYTQWTWK